LDTPVELIVGLGNPGPAYERTRHNVGADLVLNLANSHSAQFKHETKFFGDTTKINLDGISIRVLIPSTFMNLSGKSIGALAGFYQIPTERILVVHDELDLSPGIGHPGNARQVVDYVLKKASPSEQELINISIDDSLRALSLAVSGQWERAMTNLHSTD
jgi:PTH1 family peptidyl-tRNA hydrolase